MTVWANYGLPADLLKGGLCMTGLYDLRPVALSKNFAHVDLSSDEALALCPALRRVMPGCPIIVAYAERDPAEAPRQALAFADAIRAAGRRVQVLTSQGNDHWSNASSLGRPDGAMAIAALRAIVMGNNWA